MKTVTLTNNDDYYQAKAGVGYTIFALAGNDTVYGAELGDAIYGQAGVDRVFGNEGNDSLYGDYSIAQYNAALQNGTYDTLVSNSKADKIEGGSGNDYIFTGESAGDTVFAGVGHDVVVLGQGNNFVSMEGGNDKLQFAHGGSTGNSIYAGIGDDSIEGGSYNGGIAHLEDGNDTISFSLSEWTAFGDAGNDTMNVGYFASGSFYGGDGADRVNLAGRSTGITFFGGNGDDKVVGAALSKIYADGGNDFIYLTHGQDEIHGGEGADVIFAGIVPTIGASGTQDVVYGDAGADRFVFSTKAPAGNFTIDGTNTVVKDFENNVDKIALIKGQTYYHLAFANQDGNVLMTFDDGAGHQAHVTFEHTSTAQVNAGDIVYINQSFIDGMIA